MTDCRSKSTPIFVVVVESHHHALEHYHHVIRQRLRGKRKHQLHWSMLHFDSHPDLACPEEHVPAAACFFPRQMWPIGTETLRSPFCEDIKGENALAQKNLYDLMDATSAGIACWILPLVLAANLRHVHWICSSVSNQLPHGQTSLNVGAWHSTNKCERVASCLDLTPAAVVKVDLNHPYYFDDDSVVPSNELLLPRTLSLTVSELNRDVILSEAIERNNLGSPVEVTRCNNNQDSNTTKSNGDDWALDVCLDYFLCQNPFLVELINHDKEFAEALAQAVQSTRLQKQIERVSFSSCGGNIGGATTQRGSCYRQEQEQFRQGFILFLRHVAQKAQNGYDLTELHPSQEHFPELLLQSYDSAEEAKIVLRRVARSLVSSCQDPSTLIEIAEESIACITLPHESLDLDAFRHDIVDRVEIVAKAVADHTKCRRADPFMITIARSTIDGFTPEPIVNDLQCELIRVLHSTTCGCSRSRFTPGDVASTSFKDCRWNLLFDCGEWEGSSFQ